MPAHRPPVRSPWIVRVQSVRSPWIVRVQSVRSPCKVRQKPVKRPFPVCVRVCQKPVVRPCAARYPSVISPWLARRKSAAPPPPISECRKMSATDECPPVRRPSDVRRLSVQSPCASANAEGAKGEHEANAAATRHSSVRGANATRARREPQANAARAKAVCRPESVPRSHVASPWFVRHASIARTTNVRCTNRQTTERRREHSAPLFPLDKRPSQLRRPCTVRV